MSQHEAIDAVLEGFVPVGDDHPKVKETAQAVLAHLRDRTGSDCWPRPFLVVRDVDDTGVSGLGAVAEGVEFTDGVVALRWRGEWPTSVVFHDRGLESVAAIHGHGGQTRVVYREET